MKIFTLAAAVLFAGCAINSPPRPEGDTFKVLYVENDSNSPATVTVYLEHPRVRLGVVIGSRAAFTLPPYATREGILTISLSEVGGESVTLPPVTTAPTDWKFQLYIQRTLSRSILQLGQ